MGDAVLAARFTQTGIQNALAVSTVSVALTVPAGSTHMIVQNGAQPIRWRMDGMDNAPTATAGQLLAANATLEFMDPMALWPLEHFRMIRSGGIDSTVEVAFFRS